MQRLYTSMKDRISSIGQHAPLLLLSFWLYFRSTGWRLPPSSRKRRYSRRACLPAQWTFNNYVQAWNAIPMARMLSNSMLVAVSQTLLHRYKHIGGVCDGAVAIQG